MAKGFTRTRKGIRFSNGIVKRFCKKKKFPCNTEAFVLVAFWWNYSNMNERKIQQFTKQLFSVSAVADIRTSTGGRSNQNEWAQAKRANHFGQRKKLDAVSC